MLVALITLLGTSYLALQNSWVQTKITQNIAERLSKQLNANITVGKVDIGFFNKLYLEDVLVEDQHNDTLLFSKTITAQIDTLKVRRQRISIKELSFKNNELNISRDSADVFNFSFLLNAIERNNTNDTLNLWNINCQRFDFVDLDIAYHDVTTNKNMHLFANDLNLDVTNFHSLSDSVSFKLNRFSLNDGNKLSLENASADVHVQNGLVTINNLDFKSSHSEFKNTDVELQFYTEDDSMNVPFNINLRIGESKISFREIGELVPALKGMNQNVELSGLIYGNLDDLKGKNVVLRTGTSTKAVLDFYVNDLTHPENMYLFLDLKQSETSFSDVSNIRFPNQSKHRFLEFPENLYEAGIVKFNGNFSGFLSDFVTFGTLKSDMGTLTTDILVMPEKEGVLYYRGNISTSDFNLGQLFKQDKLGKLTFSGSADGDYNKTEQTISGVFKGNIEEIDFNRYKYKKIEFDGVLLDKMFDGLLSVNDPNLQFTFLGELDLNKETPRFDFNLNLKKALPSKLNIGTNFPDAEIAFNMNANFNGDRIDNLDGSIIVDEGYYKNRNGELNLGGLQLKTLAQQGVNELAFTSNFFDATVSGEYHFRSLVNSLNKIINHFVPSSNYQLMEDERINKFDYRINVKEINPLANIFVPNLQFETPFLLYGNIDSPNNNVELKGSIPGIKYKDLWARHIFVGNQSIENDTYSSKFRISELFNRNGMKLYNFTVDSKISNNVVNNLISWSNFEESTYSGSIKTQTTFSRADTAKHQHIEIKGQPSKIYVADTLWSIAPFTASIDSSDFALRNFKISHENQVFSADGQIIGGKADLLNFNFENIDLSYLDSHLKRNIALDGMVNGTIGIANVFQEPVLLSNLTVDELHYKKQFMGDISLISQWNRFQSTIDSELRIVRNDRQNLKAFGYFKPSTKELQYYAEVDSLSLIVLETFMKRNFSDFKGYGTGKAEIGGTLQKLDINGAIFAEEAGLTVNVTQIPYWFTDTIYFKNDTIDFDNLTVYDDENNDGKFDGIIVHENFRNMKFDLSFSSEKIRAMNTTSRDNEQFYGTAIANGRLDIKGVASKTDLIGTATTLLGTDIKISMESESTVAQYDFIEFVKTEETEENDFFELEEKAKSGDFDLGLTIEATPEAKVQLIYNSQIGDIIKAQGEGILLFEMDNNDNMSLSGNYNPTKGDYLFTLQNVINKRFTIEQGGSIIWSGDPYNAIIDLNAIYKLKASVSDLPATSQQLINPNQRIQVECIIQLEDELINPTIGFDINFPNADERDKDLLSQFFTTDEEMNKQILSLIVMGKFYTPEYMRGNYEAQNANMLGTTASEMFSNQLSNWLSQISSNWDVGFNYRPGNQVTDDEIEVALSTQIFNDRVTLNGNIGNNTNQYGTNNNSSQIVGDFEMSVKLVPSGKIQLKAYNRSNNNLIYETAPYTQGVGLSFKEEYNSIDELFQKLGSIFKKKNK